MTAYATADELARILTLSSPSAAQTAALDRVLEAAAAEIDGYLSLTTPLVAPYPALVVEVNLERAVDHWRAEQSPFGLVSLGGDTGATGFAARNTFRRHATTLLPLKEGFGVG